VLDGLRQQVWEANVALPHNQLTMWTSGNASGRDEATGFVIIKPSGVEYDKLGPDDLVVVDLDGAIIEGRLRPSVDTASHLYIYRHRPDVSGVVHTHSPFATSFAIRGETLPIYTTTSAAVFGAEIPVTAFATIGDEEIGREVVNGIGTGTAILVRRHGVFTIGPTAIAAVKSAVILEETAQVVHYARLRGPLDPLPAETIKRGYRVYHETYGQASPAAARG